MEGITLNTIPTWVPGVILLYTGIIWWATRKQHIRMDSRTTALTMIMWGTLYLLSALYPVEHTGDLETRVFFSRLVISLICLSQSLPMTISYLRGKARVENGE